jgi:hypothetical protein
MAGLTQTEQQATLDARFPTTGGTDFIGYSTNGTSETGNLARTAIGATGWSAATAATPSVKANANALTSAGVTTAGITVTHTAIFSASTGGTQRTDWQAVSAPKTLGVGDQVTHAAGAIQITLD